MVAGHMTHFRMPSISLAMPSSSIMAEKSLAKAPPPLALLAVVVAMEVVDVVLVMATEDVASCAVEAGVGRRGGVDVKGVGAHSEVEGCEGCVGGCCCCCLRREGGIMAGVSSLGGSLPRTFSATMCMASANCSAFSLPFFWTSHRFLQGDHTSATCQLTISAKLLLVPGRRHHMQYSQRGN